MRRYLYRKRRPVVYSGCLRPNFANNLLRKDVAQEVSDLADNPAEQGLPSILKIDISLAHGHLAALMSESQIKTTEILPYSEKMPSYNSGTIY